MTRRFAILATIIALCALCAGQALAAQETTVRGRLARTVEAGGWLIVTNDERYLILNPQQWGQETWFREGTEVEATGEPRPGTPTIYQEGVPFQARTLRRASGGSAVVPPPFPRLTRVSVTGESIVQAQPDTAIVVIAVVTQRSSALEAQQENARQSEAVVRAVRAAAGAGAEVKTSGYSLQPQRVYRQNQPPTITGYEARNAVTVTMGDLNRVGAVIDAAAQAGANNIDSLAFTLRRDRPARDQALTEATRAALNKAQVIAQALGGRVVRIVEVQEAGAVRPPIPVYRAEMDAMQARAAAPPTPIEVGSLEIRSQVQLIAEIEAR